MVSKLKQRRLRRLKADVAWWREEAEDCRSRLLELAGEIDRLKKLVIRVPMPVVVPAQSAAFIGIDLAGGEDQTAVIEIENGEVRKWSR
ncbi:hypothetical protein Q7485_23355 [Enterobacter cloacae]|uniref:hypothetical protein n=1 Tax=Enterobacter TaxID=547 RepID=UPI00073C63CA|nr:MULTISPECIES: hypothetical protein [Enterobacter]EKV7706840.1 hypothetical protein [Enterobacter cloacae]KSY74162.1 hypothetical protein APU11_04735 [Enterobacter sp. 50793107]MDO9654451.1 hypothetical protein [Enterobacter cloacae]